MEVDGTQKVCDDITEGNHGNPIEIMAGMMMINWR